MYINTETGEIIDLAQFQLAQRKAHRVAVRHRPRVSSFHRKAITNVAPLVLGGMVLAICLMGLAR